MSEHLPAVVAQAVARLQGDPLLLSTDGRTVATRVLSVAIRPFSYVARVETASSADTRRVIVKIPRLKPGKTDRRVPRLEQEVAAAQTLASTLKGETGLCVPDLVAFYPEIPAVVWGEVEGATLDEIATRIARGVPNTAELARLESAFHGAGRWLRVLQAGTAVEGREFSLTEMIDYIDIRLNRICELGPHGLGAEWRDKVRRLFREATLAPADLRLAAVHGDFSMSNVMYDGSRVVAIDFSSFGIGSTYYDVTRLYHQLGLLLHKPWFLPTTVAQLRRALLAGYDPRLRADQPVFQLFLVQHLLCHWLGLLKTSAAASLPVRGFHRWVGYRHRRELDNLIEQFHGVQPKGRLTT